MRAQLEIDENTNPNDPKNVELREKIEQYMDAGHGHCWLKDSRIAAIVQENLLHFDGIRYNLLCWCVMPNHVHVLIEVLDGCSLSQIMHGWRSYTAKEANKILGRTGQFWMEEYFDRYIRNERHLQNVVDYIHNNPVNAGLVDEAEKWKWSEYGRLMEHGRLAREDTGQRPVLPDTGEPPVLHYDYIMGNPPFVGARMMDEEQKHDMLSIFGTRWKNVGNLDYVCCWYKKASDLMLLSPDTRTALVSTNSIMQGEQVYNLWQPLLKNGLNIDFAYRTFRWDSESSLKAHVHCVIVGFSHTKVTPKVIFDGNRSNVVSNINAYLLDAPNVFIGSRQRPLCEVPDMVFGNMANDGGNLLLTHEEYGNLISSWPYAAKYTRRFVGADEFINNRMRYCLWLADADPTEIRQSEVVMQRVERVRQVRAASNRAGTRRMADYPMLFGEVRQPESNYLLVPRVSSERRRYIPIGFMTPDIIASDAVQIIPNATLYHFGVLTSNVHMAWMRAVCGRLEMRYRYSKDIVYNNFPWPGSTGGSRSTGGSPVMSQASGLCSKIEQTAQAILDARALYPESSLADLYDETSMPPILRKTHQDNDRAVMQAYGFDIKTTTESTCVAELFKLYQELTILGTREQKPQ